MNAYDLISKKRDAKSLSAEEIDFFIHGFVSGDIPAYQMSALLMAIYFQGMNSEEILNLTNTFIHSGTTIDLSDIKGKKVDKHSTGGVGDKTSIILAPVVAAAGVKLPMISGRGLGHTGGTLDKLGSVPGFRTDYSITQFKQKLSSTGACLNGQTDNLVPADKKIYALRDVTATVPSVPLICASIMSKKIAEGIDALVLDVKTGSGAFMHNHDMARTLAYNLIEIGEKSGIKVVAYITNMDNPLGKNIGNWLEIRECIDCLRGKGPDDLLEVTHTLSGTMIFLADKAESIEHGIELSKKTIDSGHAWKKFLEIVKGQNGDVSVLSDPDKYPESLLSENIYADKKGWMNSVNALQVGNVAVQLGAGRNKIEDEIDPKAGIVLHKKPADKIELNDLLMTIYTDRKSEISSATNSLKNAIHISDKPVKKPDMILEYLQK